MQIDILYEDADMLLISKPAGLLVHADGREEGETLTHWIQIRYPEIVGVGEDQRVSTGEMVHRPGIVHRLDRDTSGVMVIAKTEESFVYMKNLFQTRQVHKNYKTFVYDNIKEDAGVIDKPIGRSPKDFRQWSAEDDARGELRPAVTRWKKIVSTKTCAFLEVTPETGRTHQIRVHLKYMEHPIIADPLYAPKRPKLLGFERLALHAHILSFKTPQGTDIEIEAPYPQDFVRAIEELHKNKTEEDG